MKITWLSHTFSFPSTETPAWNSLVERWYQLDAAAYGLTEVYWRHRERIAKPPQWIFLASPGASNATDQQFAEGAAPSPAKFVHTLPNIRSASLLQVMKWSGPVFCIQNDPSTILTALQEALFLARDGGFPAWVASVTRESQGYTAHIFILDKEGDLKIANSRSGTMEMPSGHDKQWLSQLKSHFESGSELWIG